MHISRMKEIIEEAFENRSNITPRNSTLLVRDAVNEAIELLNSGQERVVEKIITHNEALPAGSSNWIVNDWLKKAILLSTRVNYADYDINDFNKDGVRIVPPAVARKGSYLAPSIMLMSSFVDIGAYVDKGTTIDTLATVGSCAQIGKNCHLSSGVSIGGMLESMQTKPTIIEDNCFIGAGSKITEGIIVEEGSIISTGVFICQNTKIYNSMTKEVSYGRIPAGSIVVSGTLPSKDGKYSLHCAVIVKRVDAGTLSETERSKLLREVS